VSGLQLDFDRRAHTARLGERRRQALVTERGQHVGVSIRAGLHGVFVAEHRDLPSSRADGNHDGSIGAP